MTDSVVILVTGADGLLGRHARAGLLAENGAASFSGREAPWVVRIARRPDFDNKERLAELCGGVSAVLHFAGINRAEESELEQGNIQLAQQVSDALDSVAPQAHVVYANSTHRDRNTAYGRGKAGAAAVFEQRAQRSKAPFSDVVLPHVFGEGGRPFYNSAVATLCHQVVGEEAPTIVEGAEVELVHAGQVVDAMLQLIQSGVGGSTRVTGQKVSVEALYSKLCHFCDCHAQDMFPQVSSLLDVSLFNTLRTVGFPEWSCTPLGQKSDDRGTLFEAAKGGQGGQTFLSWTLPGVTRGNHFHRYKIERFLVVSGEATIRIRHVLEDTVHAFKVLGNKPVAIDMPTLHTHSIENTGSDPLLTMFWAHEIFDPNNADTWALPVLCGNSHEIVHLV